MAGDGAGTDKRFSLSQTLAEPTCRSTLFQPHQNARYFSFFLYKLYPLTPLSDTVPISSSKVDNYCFIAAKDTSCPRCKMSIQSSKSRDLWARAIGTLTAEDQALIDFNNADRIIVLESAITLAEDKKRQCLNQRWRIRRGHGRNLILRDVFGKIVVWIQKFKEIGDVAVQYDPLHASLPWAGVRLLLEVRWPFILSILVLGQLLLASVDTALGHY